MTDNMFFHIIPELTELISLTFCIGALVCRIWILPQNYPSRIWTPLGICVALIFLSSIADLVLRSTEMSGQPLSEIYFTLPVVLFRTHYGHVWLTRVAAVILLAITLIAGRSYRESRKFQLPVLVIVLVISMTLSASGHASDDGDFSIPEIMDWLHLIAASVWGGGLLVLSTIVLPDVINRDNPQEELIADVARRFSNIVGVFVGVIVITASYNAWYFVRGLNALLNTTYGLTDAAKTALLFLLLLLGAFNRYVNVPLLQKWAGLSLKTKSFVGRLALDIYNRLGRSGDGRIVSFRFMKSVKVEAFLIVCVLLCAALLRHEVPARHALHLQHMGDGMSSEHPQNHNHH